MYLRKFESYRRILLSSYRASQLHDQTMVQCRWSSLLKEAAPGDYRMSSCETFWRSWVSIMNYEDLPVTLASGKTINQRVI